ncbi:OVARIAN TUMOR DOMAIN-containing deubiquitinating enzyme 9 isoform X2 [Triticum aestivum]|uniref:OVARIAN TUMOR DOMAIN-containing deubiquitinating enzyme 9 isoform X2 n=1 Tax=Triticum aestivum TaxID=4565 RepID=UPI001D01CF98|nr:OVARIAN TUMOR DOMAIN-containing deubiquitinating enzyme 9-like isoform X2 [Triticum aestivum]XP_044415528.1 OVARIAN TUMOR DOMAIN-containing deubiquitinating enzyme 9-like isoform X2 [Triticum aestivum]XP_044415529.1 OVARIAN TUMOR DOMAIN-containing deubiquitinating enzyme 9-like isoform X2 [Triticum aestivum]
MSMCEKDQNFHWAYDLFHDPFAAPNSYYGHPNGYSDSSYCDYNYARDASHPDETYLHSSALTCDMYNPQVGMYHPGNVGGQEHEAVYVDPSSSSSYPESDDCFEMEEEVGKRFYPMVPVPHVPKINGEIPSLDEATMDHERLSDRLRLYELTENKVKGDGNCQFRALSDQLYQTPDHHEFVREQIISQVINSGNLSFVILSFILCFHTFIFRLINNRFQLKSNREAYDGYVPMAYDEYLEKVSRNGEWGDHVTLQAAADKYGVKIFVMTSFKDTCYIEIQPKVQKSNKGMQMIHFLYSSKWGWFWHLTMYSAIFFFSGFSGAVELLGGGSLQLDISTERRSEVASHGEEEEMVALLAAPPLMRLSSPSSARVL